MYIHICIHGTAHRGVIDGLGVGGGLLVVERLFVQPMVEGFIRKQVFFFQKRVLRGIGSNDLARLKYENGFVNQN